MHIGLGATAAGAAAGLVVGMTGAGGGALLTPMLILFLGVKAKVAVSTDLVATLFMRPVAGTLHARRGTVVPGIVLWLSVGSVPAGFAAGWAAHLIGSATDNKDALSTYIAAALLASGALALSRRVWAARHPRPTTGDELVIRPLVTVLIGAAGGAIVGITSVGSGTLVLVALAALYPQLKTSQLVGTDLVQAIPLVGAAALGHLAASDLQLTLTAAVIIGGVPGAFVGALISRRVPEAPLATIVSIVILLSGAALLGWQVGLPVAAALAVAMATVLLVERRSADRRAVAALDLQLGEGLPASVGLAGEELD